ncbi:MAG: hypothetical protein HY707_08165 [Ignavibacteriae bacterium]|nr:hypothetical protein [Ignavibacteriota bacterium]
MEKQYIYNRVLIVIDLVYLLFCCIAVYHLTQKPGLPAEFTRSDPSRTVIAINGVPVSSVGDIEFYLAPYRVGDGVDLEVRDRRTTVFLSTRLVPYYSLRFILIKVVIGLILIVLGIFVYLKRPNEVASVFFNLSSMMVAASIIGTKTMSSIQPAWVGFSLGVLFFLAYTFVPPLFVHFTFVFPRVKWDRNLLVRRLFYTVAVLLTLWQSIAYLQAAHVHSVEYFHDSLTASSFVNGFMFFSLLFGIGNFVHSYRKAVEAAEKKKLQWILSGLCVGPSPFIIFWVLPQVFGLQPWIPEEYFEIFLVLIPLAFTISIVKYRVMDIDVIVTRSTAYAIVLLAVLVVYMGIAHLALVMMKPLVDQTTLMITTVTAVVLALLFEPLRKRIQHFVDKRFFRVRYNFREAQRKFIEAMKQCIDIKQIAELIVHRTDELFPVGRIGFFLLQEPEHRLHLLAHLFKFLFQSQVFLTKK